MEKWNSRIQFPTDNYKIRCIDESFGPSKNDSPMITLEFEVIHPEITNIGGIDYMVGGTKIIRRAVTKSEDPKKNETVRKMLDDLTTKFGLPPIEDIENPELGFKGKIVWALLRSDVQEKRKAPTADQLARGIKQGDVITNPLDGKPLINYWPQVEEIFGLAPD